MMLLAITAAVSAEPMMVTDCKGAAGVRLLDKLADQSELAVPPKASVTLTSLRDGSRVTLQGPLKVRLDSKLTLIQGKPAQVSRQAGRGASSAPPRTVSLTMGGQLTRSKPPFYVETPGAVLRPSVRWSAHASATEYLVEVLQGGQVVHRAQVDGLETSLPLSPGVEYVVKVTAQQPSPASDALQGIGTQQVKVRLLPAEEVSAVEALSRRLRAEYRKTPRQLSPLTVLLTEYLARGLYGEAQRLLAEMPSGDEVLRLRAVLEKQVAGFNGT
jgi:hypothetical protein